MDARKVIAGIPKEIEADENRVSMVPTGVGGVMGHSSRACTVKIRTVLSVEFLVLSYKLPGRSQQLKQILN